MARLGVSHCLNVGAGAGSYEPSMRFVVAVEPSAEMIRSALQRRPSLGLPPIRAFSGSLFRCRSRNTHDSSLEESQSWLPRYAGLLAIA
jgi:hypothetical protein